MSKKVKLKFMVYHLEEVAYVPNPILIKIIKSDNIFITGILGDSGRKLMINDVGFYDLLINLESLFDTSLDHQIYKLENF